MIIDKPSMVMRSEIVFKQLSHLTKLCSPLRYKKFEFNDYLIIMKTVKLMLKIFIFIFISIRYGQKLARRLAAKIDPS